MTSRSTKVCAMIVTLGAVVGSIYVLDINPYPFGVPGCGRDLRQTSYKMFKWKLAFRNFHPQKGLADTVVKNYDRLRIGMSRAAVEQALGQPDYEIDSNRNGVPRCYGWFWIYHLGEVRRTNLENYGGPLLEIRFDSDGKAYFFHPVGISGLTDRGEQRWFM